MQIKQDHILHIISGVAPGLSGTGRVMKHLIAKNKLEKDKNIKVYIHYAYYPSKNLRKMLATKQFLQLFYSALGAGVSKLWFGFKISYLLRRLRGKILIFHPQTLGFGRTLRLMQKWGDKVVLFGLDNSSFCVRSYNYIPGASESCLRCIGGNFNAAQEFNCIPFPVSNSKALDFVKELFKLLTTDKYAVLVQNQRNAELYFRHVGNHLKLKVVGLWAYDWDNLNRLSKQERSRAGYDVVYHGDYLEAKGWRWLLEVARQLQHMKFLFPFQIPSSVIEVPPNVEFKSMGWETGLHQEVTNAKIVCLPSLWSATIEGALIKSLMCARAVACVNVEGAFNNELPDNLIIKLNTTVGLAATQLKEALDKGWKPDRKVHELWVREFKENNSNMLKNLLQAIYS